jgi:predicted phosphoribosyltransferase
MSGGLWRNVPFEDRRDAGGKLAERLEALRGRGVVVLALPRGGVPVGYEVARALGAPLDVLVVRKLGVPGHEELAMGAIASGDVLVLNDDVVAMLRITKDDIDFVASRESREIERRERAYRGGRAMEEVRDRTVILVDDGLATGATMRAGVKALRKLGPRRIVVAVPVGAPASCDAIAREADELICLERPPAFYGVGQWYRDFGQTTDEEVRLLLAETRKARDRSDRVGRSAP